MRAIILAVAIFYHCAKDNDSKDCIDELKISNTVCIAIIKHIQIIVMQMLMELLIILKENVR